MRFGKLGIAIYLLYVLRISTGDCVTFLTNIRSVSSFLGSCSIGSVEQLQFSLKEIFVFTVSQLGSFFLIHSF